MSISWPFPVKGGIFVPHFHPHLHGLITKGGIDESGIFHPLPWLDTQKMALLFKDKVFAMLIQEGKISQEPASKISSWPHSGFNIHNEVQIDAGEEKGKETLAQYIVKAPVSQERMKYDMENQKVVYTPKRGTVSYEPLDWLAAITSHIPNKGAQNVHYYGVYSNKSRGIQKKSEQAEKGKLVIADSMKRWSMTIASFIIFPRNLLYHINALPKSHTIGVPEFLLSEVSFYLLRLMDS